MGPESGARGWESERLKWAPDLRLKTTVDSVCVRVCVRARVRVPVLIHL